MRRLLSIITAALAALIIAGAGTAVLAVETEASDYDVSSVGATTSETESAPNYPILTSLENTQNGVKASWNAFPGASRYRLYIRRDNRWIKVVETTATEAEYTSVTDGQNLLFTVRALDSNRDFCSNYYTNGWKHVYYAAPKVEIECNSDGSMGITWNSVSGTRYEIVRIVGGEPDSSDKIITSGGKYSVYAQRNQAMTYGVARTDSNGSRVSAYGISNTVIPYEMPVITSIENTDNGALVHFNSPSGAAKTRIYHRVNNRWVKLGDTASSSFLHKTPLKNKAERYVVRCLDRSNMFCTGYIGTGMENVFFTAPDLNSLTNTADGIALSWNAPNGYKTEIYRDNKPLTIVSSSTFTDANVISGRTYSYKIRLLKSNGTPVSGFGAGLSRIFVTQPSFSSIVNTLDGVKLSWNPCPGAVYYRVYVNENGKWINQITTTASSYLDTKVKSNNRKLYTIRALDSRRDFITQYNRSGWYHTFYEAPAITSVGKGKNGIVIKWNKVSGVGSYRVYRKPQGGNWGRIVNSVNGTEFTDKLSDTKGLYSYTVRCLDNSGEVISDYINTNPYYRNGSIASGIVTIDGKKYYYGTGSEFLTNQIVGSASEGYYYAGEDGVICESPEIKYAVDFVIKNAKGNNQREKLRSCFYKLTGFSYITQYHFPDNGTEYQETALNMFKNKGGSCFGFGGGFGAIAKVLGYETRVARGRISMVYGGLGAHGWTEVKINGTWYICDADMQKYSATTDNYYMKPYSAYPAELYRDITYNVTVKNGKAIWK